MRNTAEGLRYVIYLFVTDLKEPWKEIAEPTGFLITPRGWERVSDVSNVVFTNGAIADDDGKVYIYYAASDTRMHVASTTIGQLLDFAFKNPADPLRSRDCVAQRVALIEKNQAYLNQQDRQYRVPVAPAGCGHSFFAESIMSELGNNNPLFRAMAQLGGLVVFSVLWLLCCLPVVTAGASTLALYAVACGRK